jgi:hypothetical protein
MKTDTKKPSGEQKIDRAPSLAEIYGAVVKIETPEQADVFLKARIEAARKEHLGITEPDAENLERYRIVHFARQWEPSCLERVEKLFGKKKG